MAHQLVILLILSTCLLIMSVEVDGEQLDGNDENKNVVDVNEENKPLEWGFWKSITRSLRKQPELCSEDQKRGPCASAQKKYYYDADTKTCKTFFYSGCCGNANRFDTEKECKKFCIKKSADTKELEQHAAATASDPNLPICKKYDGLVP